LSSARWRIAYSRVITRFGIPSAVLVATKQWEGVAKDKQGRVLPDATYTA